MIPSLLATSDVLGTGWYAADAARVQSGSTVVVVGDGAVGLMGMLAANQREAGRIIAMSRHKTRQDLALEYGATDIVSERGDEGVPQIKELTNAVGADSVLECVGTKESMMHALPCQKGNGLSQTGFARLRSPPSSPDKRWWFPDLRKSTPRRARRGSAGAAMSDKQVASEDDHDARRHIPERKRNFNCNIIILFLDNSPAAT